jgi:hypothetical protein
MRGAFLKGCAAHLAGEPIANCPYSDKRKANGRLTWSRAYISAWRDGWEYAAKYRDDALITMKYAMYAKRRLPLAAT